MSSIVTLTSREAGHSLHFMVGNIQFLEPIFTQHGTEVGAIVHLVGTAVEVLETSDAIMAGLTGPKVTA